MKKKCISIPYFFLSVITLTNFACFSQTNKYSNQDLNAILQKVESNISHTPKLAEKLATRLFEISTAQNDTLFLVRSMIVIGQVKNLKGEQSLALDYYSKAASLARQKLLIKEECEAILNTGEIIYKNGNYDKSLALFLKADSIACENELEHLESYALYYIGKYHRTKGNFPQAKEYFLKSLIISRKNGDNKQLALLLPSLGKYYISEGRLNIALTYYQEAFHISTQLNDNMLIADICNHLGSLYIELKEYDKAMEYHQKALQYRLKMSYPVELASSYNNVGKVHLGLKQLDSAKFYFNKSLILCKSTNYKKGLVKTLVNIGETYRLSNELNKAASYLFEAYQTASKIGYDNGVAESGIDLGDLYFDKGNIDSAVYYYNYSLAKLIKTNYNDDLLRTYQGLFKSYNIKQDYKKALAYHVSVLEIEKKLLDVENKRQLAILNITFETERKEKDYRVLLKDNELKASLLKSKNTYILLIIVALCFTILLCFYIYNRFYIKKRANKKLEELNFRISKQNTEFEKVNKELEQVSKEKDKLFSIISHELRNPLYWLQNLAEVLSQKYQSMPPEKIKKTLLSIDESAKNVYHLMDNLLHWSRSKLNRIHPKKSQHNLYILVSETTQLYETFFQQKEIIFKNNISNNITIIADSDLFGCIIRNLVSNAIKYTPNGGQISISYTIENDFVTLIISDSGKGITAEDLENIFTPARNTLSMPGLMQEKGSGLGLKLCKDFVEMNSGEIWAESISGNGTCFFFTVPVQKTGILHEKQENIKTTPLFQTQTIHL